MAISTLDYLYNEIQIAENLLLDVYSEQERIALLSYTMDIRYAIDMLFNNQNYYLEEETEESQDPLLVSNYLSYCKENMVKDYIKDSPFHQSFLYRVIRHQDNILNDKELGETEEQFPIISKEEFYEILHSFMSSLKLESTLKKHISENRIIMKNSSTRDYGFCVYNPITNDSTIGIQSNGYNISSLVNTAHEFGHVYDFNTFPVSITDFNRYMYQTFNKEVVSKLFEKLVLDFLIENDIHRKEAQNKLLNTTTGDKMITLNAYILSLLKSRYLYNDDYKYLGRREILSQIKNRFNNTEYINQKLKYMLNYLDLGENNTYAYGSAVALLLKDSVKQDGLDSPLLKEFLNSRKNPSCREFLEGSGLTTDYYGQCLEKRATTNKKIIVKL